MGGCDMLERNLNMAFPFIFHKEEDSGYFIECADIDGVYTGIDEDDIAYGMSMAEEVLGMTLADMLEKGEAIPKPSNIKELSCDDGFVTLVMVDVEKYIRDTTLVKKTLNIPKWANDLGVRLGINFSKALTDTISSMAVTK
jgi:hypothetical protein